VHGIPLAIELASARLRSLGVADLWARLEQGFRLLTGGSRTALARHQTLAALIDWSYELLSDRERVVLARLSVFVGGFDLTAAKAVCAAQTIDELDVIELLTALVDKSLVAVDDVGDSLRYRLLETVREYAAERLAEHDRSAVKTARRAHRDFYLQLAETSVPLLAGGDQSICQQRLQTEHDNLRAALRFSLIDPDPEPGLRLASALQTFWRNTGYRLEGAAATDAQLQRPQASARTPARASALVGASLLAEERGELRVAEAYAEEAVAIARTHDDGRVTGAALSGLGWVRMRQGRTQ
jgi:non-specific serine/threonine protein kinase